MKKKFFKSILCLLLVFLSITSFGQVAFAKTNPKNLVGPDPEIELTITPDSENFSKNGQIFFTVTVKNISGKALENVEVKVTPQMDRCFHHENNENICEIPYLEKDETQTVKIGFTHFTRFMRLYKIMIYFFIPAPAIFYPYFILFDFAGRSAFRNTDFNYIEQYKINNVNYKFGFSVTHFESEKPIETTTYIDPEI